MIPEKADEPRHPARHQGPLLEIGIQGSGKAYNSVVAHRHRNAAVLAKNVPTKVVQVNSHNRVFQLASPIDLDARWEEGRFVIDYEPLHISVYEKDEQEAYAAFAEMFETVWEQIAEAPDRDLTGDAQKLKRRFQDLVKRSTPNQE